MAVGRQLHRRRRRVLALVVQVGRRLAGQAGAQRGDDLLLRHAEHGGLAAVDQQQRARRGGDAAVVDVDHAVGLLEHAAHRLRHLPAAGGVGAVDLGDDRRQHRRAGRHFDDLDVGAEALADLLQRRPHAGGDGVALLAAVVLVDQVDLQVADLAAAAQVVLAHQAVEVDRRGGAGIGLVVGHLGHRRQVRAEFVQHRGGLLHRRAGRHVDDDLELRLVVERQHLQQHQAGGRQRQRDGDQHGDAQAEQAAVAPRRARRRAGAGRRARRPAPSLPARP